MDDDVADRACEVVLLFFVIDCEQNLHLKRKMFWSEWFVILPKLSYTHQLTNYNFYEKSEFYQRAAYFQRIRAVRSFIECWQYFGTGNGMQ